MRCRPRPARPDWRSGFGPATDVSAETRRRRDRYAPADPVRLRPPRVPPQPARAQPLSHRPVLLALAVRGVARHRMREPRLALDAEARRACTPTTFLSISSATGIVFAHSEALLRIIDRCTTPVTSSEPPGLRAATGCLSVRILLGQAAPRPVRPRGQLSRCHRQPRSDRRESGAVGLRQALAHPGQHAGHESVLHDGRAIGGRGRRPRGRGRQDRSDQALRGRSRSPYGAGRSPTARRCRAGGVAARDPRTGRDARGPAGLPRQDARPVAAHAKRGLRPDHERRGRAPRLRADPRCRLPASDARPGGLVPLRPDADRIPGRHRFELRLRGCRDRTSGMAPPGPQPARRLRGRSRTANHPRRHARGGTLSAQPCPGTRCDQGHRRDAGRAARSCDPVRGCEPGQVEQRDGR